MLFPSRPGEDMAHCVPSEGEEDCCPAYGFRARQWSACSTMLPSSPPMSPPMSRTSSPRNSFDFGEWREEIGGDRFDFELSGFHDEVSEVVLPTVKVAQAAESTRKSSTPSSARRMIFLPTLIGLVSYGLLNSLSFRIVLGLVAAAMLLPGLFLYMVDGCRPADYEEKDNAIPRKSVSHELLLVCLVLGSLYSLDISIALRALMGAVAALMLLPGFYLYVVEGCRPEDFKEEDDLSQKKVGTLVISLVSLGLASLYGMCVSMAFHLCMGVVAALMLLPGLYLYVVDGCRPEDHEEQTDDSQQKGHGFAVFLLGSLAFGGFSGVCLSTFVCAFMVAVAALMLLPGFYLYVVEGCRPEDFKEEDDLSQKKLGTLVISLVILGLASLYGICVSMVFRLCMGVVAALMLLPGLYLYVVDDCRPEDHEEQTKDSQQKGHGFAVFLLGSLAFGGFSGVCLSTFVCAFMVAVAALMLLPGFYLYVVEGCRPEDYSEDETMGEKSWAFAFSFGLAALYGMRISMVFCVCMGAVAALMVLPGLYLYMVDGCRPEDVEEEGFVNEKKDGLSMLLLLGLGVASVYGICVSTVFSVFMAVVVVLMLLPGLYLWLDGCRPEDYEEVDESHKQGNSFLPWFVCLGLLSFSWFGIYTHCYVFMGAMAALMFLPGLYLYVVDGCRPEDFEEEANTNEARDMAFLLLLAGVALGCLYCLRSSTAFLAFLGVGSVLMLLPGLYLWVVDGCRPEDYVEEDTGDQKNVAAVAALLLGLVLASLYGMWMSIVFRAMFGAAGATMFLPGLYLYVVDGCRPEDFEKEQDDANYQKSGASVLFPVSLGIGCMYGMCISNVFCVFMGAVVVPLLLPGMYLYMVDGCRPEDCTEELDFKSD